MRESSLTKHTVRWVLCLAVLTAWLCCAGSTAYADELKGSVTTVDPIYHSENISTKVYDIANGFPSSGANAIAQTRDGFLWFGSYNGLIRYDGNTFELIDSSTGISSVVDLEVDAQDRLWIGTNDNGLFMLKDGKLRQWGEASTLGNAKLTWLTEGDDGNIYAATPSGITYITPDLDLHAVEDPLIKGTYIYSIVNGPDGAMYCTSNNDELYILKDGKVVKHYGHKEGDDPDFTAVIPDPDNPEKLYFNTGGSTLYHGEPEQDLEKMEKIDISPLFDVTDMQLIGKTIWICTSNGIGALDHKGFHYLDNLPFDNSVDSVISDYEGNLWFGSSRLGVMKVVYNQFTNVISQYGLPEVVVNSTCLLGDELFVGTNTGLMILGKDGPLKSYPLKSAVTASGKDMKEKDLLEMMKECRIRSILKDSKERLWMSTWNHEGLYMYDHGDVTVFTMDDGMPTNRIRAMSEADDGSILVAHSMGMTVIRNGRIEKNVGQDDGIANTEILTVESAPNGDILLGSNGGGIYVVNKGGVHCIDTSKGLPSDIIMRIKYDKKRHLFWIIGSNHIAYMSEDYKVTTISHFPYPDNFDLYENENEEMWILGSNGIHVIPTVELMANGNMHPAHYGIANGLPCITTSNSYSCISPDGYLYISGSSGVVKININTPLEDISDLKQAVPFIDADGKRIYPDRSGNFRIPANTQKLTVHPAVFNYSLTDPLVSYRLGGFERTSVTVRRSELRPLTYTNLQGGTYHFILEVKDNMGRKSKHLSVTIAKTRAIHERTWFYLIITLIIILLLTFGFRSYYRRKLQEMEEKHKKEEQQQRLSHELYMASQIQLRMLPHEFPPFPDRNEFDIYASMKPAREVGGDLYDYAMLDEDHLLLLIGDVSGKGIPAALFMTVSKVLLQSFARMDLSASEILTKANNVVCSNNPLDMFITIWMGILEISSGKLVAANAGHEYPVLKRADGEFELIKDVHGMVVGGLEGLKYKEYEWQLSPGDKLFLYTDGVPEANNSNQEMFGNERMLATLNQDPDASPQELLETMRHSVREFVGDAEQFDDITMLCIEYKGPQPKDE